MALNCRFQANKTREDQVRNPASIDSPEGHRVVAEKQENPDEICRAELATIAKGAGITFVGKIIGGAIQYLYLVLLARSLGAGSLGILTMGLIIVDFIGIVSRFGMEGGTVKFVSQFNGENDKERVKGTIVNALVISFVLSLIVSVVIMVTPASYLDLSGDKQDYLAVVKILALSLPFSSLMVVLLFSTQGFKNMVYTVYGINIILPVTTVVVFLLLVYSGFGIKSAAWAYVAATFVAFIFSLVCLKRIFPDITRITPVYQLRQLVEFSLPMLVMYISFYFILWSDVFFLGYFRSDVEVGAYNAAMKTVVLIKMVITSFGPIFSPIISELHHKRELKNWKICTRPQTGGLLPSVCRFFS